MCIASALPDMPYGRVREHGQRDREWTWRKTSALESRLLLSADKPKKPTRCTIRLALGDDDLGADCFDARVLKSCFSVCLLRYFQDPHQSPKMYRYWLLLLPGADIVEIGQRSTRQSLLLLSLFTCYAIFVILPPVSPSCMRANHRSSRTLPRHHPAFALIRHLPSPRGG
jgi:hypothetical protein